MQHRHRTVRRVPARVDPPEVVQLRRVRLSVVADADHPLKGGKILKLDQFHFARERGLGVFPAQQMRARSVIPPLARYDARRGERDPFPAASLAAPEGKREIGGVAPAARVPLLEQELHPLGDKRHLAGRRLRGIRLDRNPGTLDAWGKQHRRGQIQ